MLFVLILHPPQNCIRGKKREAEFIGDAREITRVESYNGLRPSVYCGLKHHVVVGIPQPWAPQEMGLDRFGDGCKTSRTISASATVIPAFARCSGRVRTASYSRNKATVATIVSSRRRMSLTTSAAAPVRRCVGAASHNFSYISLVYRQMHPGDALVPIFCRGHKLFFLFLPNHSSVPLPVDREHCSAGRRAGTSREISSLLRPLFSNSAGSTHLQRSRVAHAGGGSLRSTVRAFGS